MSGICLDALNPVGHPTARRLNNIHTRSIRLEIRDDIQYENYFNSLHNEFQHYALIGPSTNWVFAAIGVRSIRPQVVIIGNEPDNEGPSSWTMTIDEYVALWNKYALQLRIFYPSIKLCAAGMVGTPHYLSVCWPNLNPKPDMVNKHYPNSEEELQEYKEIFNRPVIVGEWCWKTATQSEMTDWVQMLSNNCLEHFWFCWSDGMVDGMGLVNSQGRTTVAYRRYKKAIESLKGI